MELKKSRDITHEKKHSFIFIHNQSNTGGETLPGIPNNVPLGQAGDGNSICLANKHDIIVTSIPVDPAYLEYWSSVLHLSVPQIFTPKRFNTDLVGSMNECKQEFVEFVKRLQDQGVVKRKLILSVFEADERDIELLEVLQKAGIENLDSECNYKLLELGNKDGFRKFCTDNRITQLPGGNFSDIKELEKFVDSQHKLGHTVVIKSPHGIGGGGQLRLHPPLDENSDPSHRVVKAGGADVRNDISKDEPDAKSATAVSISGTGSWQATAQEWIKKEHAVAAEQFADAAERELVVDFYVDPTDNHHTAVVFDQLVKNTNESAGMSYYGAKYPSSAVNARERIIAEAEEKVAPALQRLGYRGPAGVDVLWNPLHFMELNMRTDAITYVKHLTDRIAKNLYQCKPGTAAFVSLVNLPHSDKLSTMLEKHRSGALAKADDGIFAFSNPNRQNWGQFDVVAVSPLGVKEAEAVLSRGLVNIWGQEKADEFLKAIYHPHPQFVPEVSGPLPYIVSLPKKYFDNRLRDKKWPVILFLHGMGERGEELMAVLEHGIPKSTRDDPKFPFIGINPQLPKDFEVWDVKQLQDILDQVEKIYRVDTEQEFVTGMSMGGHGTWAMALAQPGRFAAIAPICGDAHEDVENISSIAHMPTWVFHGTHDSVVRFDDSQKMVEALKAAGNTDVKFTEYKGGEHDVWTETYSNPELYSWLLQHRRSAPQ